MRNLLLIASLTLREAARRRLVVTAFGVTLVLVVLTAAGFHQLATPHGGHALDRHEMLVATSMLEIFMAFMFSFVLALGAAFLGALSLGSEIENGTLLAVLPRPLRRIEVLAGKWLGNAVLLGAYAAGTAVVEFAAAYAMTGYFPPNVVTTIVLLVAQSLVLLTLTLTLSVRLSAVAAGFLTVVLYGIAWIAGIAGSIGAVLHNDGIAHAATAMSLLVPSDGLWRAASFSMEPALLAAITPADSVNPLVPAAPPPAIYYAWCMLWFAVVFAAGMRWFARRDI